MYIHPTVLHSAYCPPGKPLLPPPSCPAGPPIKSVSLPTSREVSPLGKQPLPPPPPPANLPPPLQGSAGADRKVGWLEMCWQTPRLAGKCQFIYELIFQSKFLPESAFIAPIRNCNKTANNEINTRFISIATLIPLWYPEVNPF